MRGEDIRWVLTADEGHDCMGHGLEEEETVVHVDLDQHDCTSGNNIEEDDDVERADGVEYHIPWTSQGLLELRHHDFFGCEGSNARRLRDVNQEITLQTGQVVYAEVLICLRCVVGQDKTASWAGGN